MLHADELQKGQNQIPFPLALLESVRMPQAKSAKITSSMEYAGQPYQVQVSGSQVLIGLVSALGSLSLFLWALRLWLFGG